MNPYKQTLYFVIIYIYERPPLLTLSSLSPSLEFPSLLPDEQCPPSNDVLLQDMGLMKCLLVKVLKLTSLWVFLADQFIQRKALRAALGQVLSRMFPQELSKVSGVKKRRKNVCGAED